MPVCGACRYQTADNPDIRGSHPRIADEPKIVRIAADAIRTASEPNRQEPYPQAPENWNSLDKEALKQALHLQHRDVAKGLAEQISDVGPYRWT